MPRILMRGALRARLHVLAQGAALESVPPGPDDNARLALGHRLEGGGKAEDQEIDSFWKLETPEFIPGGLSRRTQRTCGSSSPRRASPACGGARGDTHKGSG